ncbi:hypothetical protein SAMN05216308_101130 [Nitrosospira sp. Nsp13]|nr:hypothetical protein SAMN05216308_101130 [Nitrosospira sp. Nsp13]
MVLRNHYTILQNQDSVNVICGTSVIRNNLAVTDHHLPSIKAYPDLSAPLRPVKQTTSINEIFDRARYKKP